MSSVKRYVRIQFRSPAAHLSMKLSSTIIGLHPELWLRSSQYIRTHLWPTPNNDHEALTRLEAYSSSHVHFLSLLAFVSLATSNPLRTATGCGGLKVDIDDGLVSHQSRYVVVDPLRARSRTEGARRFGPAAGATGIKFADAISTVLVDRHDGLPSNRVQHLYPASLLSALSQLG